MITKEEVIKLANLTRLDFSDDELDRIIKCKCIKRMLLCKGRYINERNHFTFITNA